MSPRKHNIILERLEIMSKLRSTVLALLNLGFTFILVNGEEGAAFCAKPTPAPINGNDAAYIHKMFKTGWNVPFGNSVIQKRWAKLFQRGDTPADNDASCFRLNIDLNGLTMGGTITGYDKLSAPWNCTFSDKYHVFECDYCDKNGIKKESAKVYITYMDEFSSTGDHNAFASVLCYTDGSVGWYITSISKTLSDKEMKTITASYKALGFDPESRLTLHSEKCK